MRAQSRSKLIELCSFSQLAIDMACGTPEDERFDILAPGQEAGPAGTSEVFLKKFDFNSGPFRRKIVGHDVETKVVVGERVIGIRVNFRHVLFERGLVKTGIFDFILVEPVLDGLWELIVFGADVLPVKISDFFEPEVDICQNTLAIPPQSGV